ncbi:MAG: response regulator transcription factor [Anaerolineales bacterium]|nr:response regulator transcription factor [Anaerolineales bacterium]
MTIRILLIDDHAVMRDGLRALLEADSELRVVGDAADGREGVRQAQALRPDVAIVDIAMPGLNGVEAARQIGESCPETRVIMLSMYSAAEYVYRALQAGARGYLLKESAGPSVVEAVRAVYSGRRYLSPALSETVLDEYVRQRAKQDPLSLLSQREREVLQLLVEGKSSAEMGALLGLSSKTVETYRSRIMEKLGIDNVPGLVKFALQHGLTTLE